MPANMAEAAECWPILCSEEEKQNFKWLQALNERMQVMRSKA